MLINGREIADGMYQQLQERVGELQKKGVIPHLVVIFVGNDPASASYIKQKQKSGEKIGAKVTIESYPDTITTERLLERIQILNTDSTVHAIIVQKPVPKQVDIQQVDETVIPEKDIDGFNPKSQYVLALPLAVVKVLQTVHTLLHLNTRFISWLQTKKIVLIGKGKTGGYPIRIYLEKLGIHPNVIDSQTDPDEKKRLLQTADILIPAVGKEHVVTAKDIQPGVILVGVGLSRNNEGKLKGEYDEEGIKEIASFYTPTPGGVGPVNVACLMENLVTAAEKQTV